MSRWFANPDAITAPDDVEWAPWVRYTRMPPVYDAPGTKEVAAYTPEEQALNSSVHESGHAVLYMAAGHRINSITLDPADGLQREAQASIDYEPGATGPWLDFVLKDAAGERAETRWLHETGRWTPGRAWVAERHAWHDRKHADEVVRTCHGRELTFNGDHGDWGDYAWIMDRADEALDPVWEQVLALAHYVAEHRRVTGEEAARITGFAR
ncbi:hypothetical protein ABZ609_03900 [Streptomyces rubiginosohelvolus]|uniref:hypothetical protein n=1 Tax=Streptomyces rubiginosohelvolus TaxID=67362 RepID=UPI00340AF7EB